MRLEGQFVFVIEQRISESRRLGGDRQELRLQGDQYIDQGDETLGQVEYQRGVGEQFVGCDLVLFYELLGFLLEMLFFRNLLKCLIER